MVDDLLDVTRIERGKIELDRTCMDLCGVVLRTCEDHRTIFEQRRADLRYDLPHGSIWIHADATRISQVLGNLLHKSVKFTPEAGSVLVNNAQVRDGQAELMVTDTGIGILPEEVEGMFEPFAQAQQGLARTHGGLGLGLTLAKRLVELHGGSMSARSDGPGRGSEFRVSSATPYWGCGSSGASWRAHRARVIDAGLGSPTTETKRLQLWAGSGQPEPPAGEQMPQARGAGQRGTAAATAAAVISWTWFGLLAPNTANPGRTRAPASR